MNNNIFSSSRRLTPWSEDDEATALQRFIDRCNQDNYQKKHPLVGDTVEAEFLNSFEVDTCRHCGSGNIKRFGYTATGLARFQCKDCRKTFTIITNTIFDQRKIPLTEWLDFLLSITGYGSFSLTSKTNRNASNTTKYWIKKLFAILAGSQKGIVLEGKVYYDETFYSVPISERVRKEDGSLPRGLSRNKICIGVATDGKQVVCHKVGYGKPSSKAVFAVFADHIKPGSTLIHDGDNAHRKLVAELHLNEEVYTTAQTKGLKDDDNPLRPINKEHSQLKKFLKAHSGFDRDTIDGYLDLYSLIASIPMNKFRKVEKVMKLAFENPILIRYRR